jgi:DNA-binding winged helix-turn-helix (wHTH) protein
LSFCERCSEEIERGTPLPDWLAEMVRYRFFERGVNHRVFRRGYLSPAPYKVLKILWSRRDRVTSRESFMTLLYAHLEEPRCESIINVHIHDLRRALAKTNLEIINYPREGYRLMQRGGIPLVRNDPYSGSASAEDLANYPSSG